ncbi:Late embryogenesis abundant protein [Macleaya cordata]|uniref:Late embryogenesis abundant protein n=1 Tax=Macleaya cordata TaxID=56857 RepID=A0A200QL38_MACCD|nr:Late embryogenesis abundant protein [Macleaya cordata]
MRSFSVSGLNQENGLENARISFDVTARNPNQNIGIYYDAMDGTVFYQEQSIGATPLLFPFYQSSKNTTWIHGELSGTSLTVNSDKWKKFMDELATGKVGFRLDLTATIRFKVSTWDSKHHRMHASCLVEVGQDGMILATSKDKRCSVYFS